MTSPVRAAAVLALGFLAFHLPFLPHSLEDLDSINFALGLQRFDVAAHQPHPPGYPVYVFIVRAVHALVGSEVRALALVSVVSGAVAIGLMLEVFRRWAEADAPPWVPMGATVLGATSPLYWITAARPLSDMMGLAASLGVQALALRARSDAAVGVAALLAGLAVGIRSQVAWLTVPTLVLAIVARPSGRQRLQTAVHGLAGLAAGALVWGVPLVVISGGPASYLRALAAQGSEDFTGVSMLATSPTPRQWASALYYALVAPWAASPFGAVMVTLAAAGVIVAAGAHRRRLLLPLIGFGPYAVFDLLFQEMVTTRYALPLVLPVAYFAVRATAAFPARVSSLATVAVAGVSLMIGGPSLMAYASVPAPAFRLLSAMAAGDAARQDERPVLAMHRRQSLDMRRPLMWDRDRTVAIDRQLAAPPKHEWLELVKYWNDGGRRPVWFVADPPRSDLALIDRRSLRQLGEYRWTVAWPQLIGGIRPNVMDWYRIEPPGWYLGEGWALTPETAGVAKEDGRGPGRAPIEGRIRRRPESVTLMLGGRNLTVADPPVRLEVTIDGRVIHARSVAPGFFLELLTLEAGALAGEGDYARIAVTAERDQIAIEQFDVQAQGEIVFGFADGWQELEYNPAAGRLWRWTTERATIKLRSSRRRLSLGLRGEFETSAATAHVTLRVGDRVVSEHDVPKSFRLETVIPAELVAAEADTLVTIETDQWYVPAETNWRPTGDQRHLGLRIFDCDIKALP